ncbi:MAG TPA: IclR family transcriptional regulator [Solirubrobacteraceae bacterium]|jgi:DNA-binding IclR family transcriptional regulator|nr:IclR family transcriptional regulator [Solirubrobacteraceae bacterium]
MSSEELASVDTDTAEGFLRGRRVRSAERVAAVLDLLRRSPQPLRHADVAKALELPKSSASNLLDTLVDVGLVRQDERRYALGVKLIELGAAAAERLDIRRIARPVLRDLSELGIGTSNLAILEGHDVLYIEKLNNPEHVIQIATRVGGTVSAHTTALGKVLVAALPPEERTRWLDTHAFEPVTEYTITSASDFQQALEFAAANGYALDDQESNLQTLCVAAPIRDHTGTTVAAISLTCLSAEVGDERELLVAAVIGGAEQVSELLGAASSTRS